MNLFCILQHQVVVVVGQDPKNRLVGGRWVDSESPKVEAGSCLVRGGGLPEPLAKGGGAP